MFALPALYFAANLFLIEILPLIVDTCSTNISETLRIRPETTSKY